MGEMQDPLHVPTLEPSSWLTYSTEPLDSSATSIPRETPPSQPSDQPSSSPLSSIASRAKRTIRPPKNFIPDNPTVVQTANKPKFTERLTTSLKQCRMVLRELLSVKYHSIAWPFYHPVDYVALGIPDYPHVIKKPMDLETIKNNLDYRQYRNAAEFAADVRLMFQNCFRYNPQDSVVAKQGRQLQDVLQNPKLRDLTASQDLVGEAHTDIDHFDVDHFDNVFESSFAKVIPDDVDYVRQVASPSKSLTKRPRSTSRSAALVKSKRAKHSVESDEESSAESEIKEDYDSSDLVSLHEKIQQIEEHIKHLTAKKKHHEARKAATAASDGPVVSSSRNSDSSRESTGSGRSGRDKKKKSEKTLPVHKKSKPAEEAPQPSKPVTAAATVTYVAPMSYEEKRALSLDINKLSQDKLVGLLDVMKRNEPGFKDDDAEEVEIDIEKTSDKTLRMLQAFVKSSLRRRRTNRPKTDPAKKKPKKADVKKPHGIRRSAERPKIVKTTSLTDSEDSAEE